MQDLILKTMNTNKKKSKQSEVIIKSSKDINLFIKKIFQKDTFTQNGAITHSTTGSFVVDDFATSGAYRNRDMSKVFSDMNTLWAENPKHALASIFYLRMISRKSKGFVETDKQQKGQGNRDESFRRLLWLAYFKPETFYKNIWLLPVVGSWKDIFTLLSIDYERKINNKVIFDLIQRGLEDKYNKNLVKKFMPSIKAKSKLTTDRAKILNYIAHGLKNYLGLSEKEYRKLKSTGEAHTFQKQISRGLFEEIDFGKISGKALSLIANGKFLSKHNLEDKFLNWLDKKEDINFNGYPHELLLNLKKSNSLINRFTVDKQFERLVLNGKEIPLNGNILPVLDTSGSMGCFSTDGKTKVIEICLSLGVYFSTINEGYFKDIVCMFDDISTIKKLSGSFSDKINQIQSERTAWGSTNFESVITLLIKMRKENPEIPISDFPDTLLVVSDMDFNPVGGNSETNYENALKRLSEVGLGEMKFIWWRPCVPKSPNQPATIDDNGVYFMSGFDGSTISLLLGGEQKIDKNGKVIKPTMKEKLEEAYTQELLSFLEI